MTTMKNQMLVVISFHVYPQTGSSPIFSSIIDAEPFHLKLTVKDMAKNAFLMMGPSYLCFPLH